MRIAIRTVAMLAAAVALGASSAASATPGIHTLPVFQTASHAIACRLAGGTMRCDVTHRAYTLPARPASCSHHARFGQGVEVSKTGSGHLVCTGGTIVNPHLKVLPYSSTDRVGVFFCGNQVRGITCTNSTDGHGFFVSSASYRLF